MIILYVVPVLYIYDYQLYMSWLCSYRKCGTKKKKTKNKIIENKKFVKPIVAVIV